MASEPMTEDEIEKAREHMEAAEEGAKRFGAWWLSVVRYARHLEARAERAERERDVARRLAHAWRKWAGLVGWATDGEPEPYEFPWEEAPDGE